MKKLLKSRTIRFALVLEILGVIQVNADFLSTVMTPAQFGYVMLGVGIAIKLLRFVTTTPMTEK